MNILVVEDEHLALDDLLAMLQPFASAHRVIGCASPDEALACAAATPPDLLITDIRMPEIDGLELVRRLKASAPHLAAIVLSGYSEFEYAREGLRLGIADYLLKPVRTATLHATVTRALGTLADAQAQAGHLREAQLARVLRAGRRTASPEPDLLAGEWGMIVLVCENWEGPVVWRDTPIDRAFIRSVLAGHPCDIVDFDARCRVALLPLAGLQLQLLDTLANRLHQAIAGAGVLAHSTYTYKGTNDRPERVLAEGMHRLEQALRLGMPTFARPSATPEPPVSDMVRTHIPLIARALAEGKPAAVADIHAALAQLQREQAPAHAVGHALDTLFAQLAQHIRATPGAHAPEHAAIVAAVRSSRSHADLLEWVDEQLQPLLQAERGAITPRQLVRTLVAHVRNSYTSDISLQAFVAEHGVSLAYFSRLFKTEIGMTFSDYLTQVRIEKAKELLAQNDLRLGDVGALVGYDDPKYFSQIFRKIAGMSPSDYQRSSQRERQRSG